MEEKNNGKGIFYGVIGVATLIVAIMGATFAFFSAQATVNGNDDVKGGTNDMVNSLTAEVVKVFTDVTATSGTGLVPSNIDGTAAYVNGAIKDKCINQGYTGCHLYQIHVKSEQDVAAVDLRLSSLKYTAKGNAKNKNWNFIVYQAGEDAKTASDLYNMSGEAILSGSGNTFEVSDATQNRTIRSNGMKAGQDYYYYLLIWLKNEEVSQNSEGNSELGTYDGSISFTAAGGGQVKATFSAAS